jgi:hypothetical protein
MLVLLHTISASCSLRSPPGQLTLNLLRDSANRIIASIYEGDGL